MYVYVSFTLSAPERITFAHVWVPKLRHQYAPPPVRIFGRNLSKRKSRTDKRTLELSPMNDRRFTRVIIAVMVWWRRFSKCVYECDCPQEKVMMTKDEWKPACRDVCLSITSLGRCTWSLSLGPIVQHGQWEFFGESVLHLARQSAGTVISH